jgi:putative oxidoreductase
MSSIAAVFGRILIALIFIVMGAGILSAPTAFEELITGVGMPAGLAIPVGAFEVLAGLCLVVGLMTRLVSVLLFVFVAVTMLMFHLRLGSTEQLTMALFDMAIMGGLLMVFAHSQVRWSVDAMRNARLRDRAALDAQQRAHAAELRAAHAEGVAEAVAPPSRRWWQP